MERRRVMAAAIRFLLPALAILCVTPPPACGGEAEVRAVDDALRERYGLKDDFYRKVTDAKGLHILSSEQVDDRALLEVRYLILRVLDGRDDVLQALIGRKLRIGVMACNEYTTDMPETRKMNPWWNKRARGLGGNPTTCAEENVLNFRGDPYTGENIFIHEFAHAVHHSGLSVVDETFDRRLRDLFKRVKAGGDFEGYAMNSFGELWAEGVQTWFHCNTAGLVWTGGEKRKPLYTREDLKAHLPGLAALMEEVFPGNAWTYTTTDKRTDLPHLKGYDRAKAPTFVWPKAVLDAFHAQEEKNRARRKKKSGSPSDRK